MRFKSLALAALVASMGLYSCGKISPVSSDSDQIFVEASDGVVIEQTSLAQEIAQASSKPGFRGSANTLNLTEEQQATIHTLHEAYKNERKAVIAAAQEAGANRNTLRQQLTALREKFNQDFLTILTPEQHAQYQEMETQRKQRRGRNPRGGQKGGNRATGPFANLDLTEEQQAAIQTLLNTQAEQVKVAREVSRTNNIDPETFRSQLDAIAAEFTTGLAGVLTEDQWAIYQQARQARANRLPNPFERLNLTEEQRTAVRELLHSVNAKTKTLLEAALSDGADQDALQAQLEAIKAELETGLAGILTEDQLATYQQAQQPRRAGRSKARGRRGGRRGPRAPQGETSAPSGQSDTS
ncbi:MAG: hypothetical protein O7G87_02580 [bacterium]|nr:hypothetical protein [bacterium]